MSNTEKLKTAGLNADGTSRLSVTKKKKSKSRWIVPAIIGGAALFAGIGGMGASSGQGFLSSLFGAGKKAAGTVGSSIGKFFTGGSSLAGASSALSSTTQESGIFGTLFDKLGSLSGSQLIGLGQIASVAGSTLGALFEEDNGIDPERLFEEEKRQFDLLLAAEYDIAGAKIDQAIREGALAGTYMGHTNPIFGALEGVNTTEGYTPSKPASIPGIHPVSGGLISQAENTA
jgi:hypothetical protein